MNKNLHSWSFIYRPIGDNHSVLEVQDIPAPVPASAKRALNDVISAEIGNRSNLKYFVALWRDSKDTSGNATAISFHGDEVEIENLYDMWEPVRIPKSEFEIFCNELDSFFAKQAK